MKYIDKELIRKEIERRHAYQKDMYNKTKPDGRPNDGWAESLAIMGELEELLAFLDTLPEQPVEGLEEEVKQYFQGLWPGMETAEQCNTDMRFTPPAIMRLARHFAEWGARHSINWGDVQLLDTFILELSREEKDGADWGDSEKFYTEVLRRFHEFNDKKIPEIVAEWEAEHLKR